jgi:hypothetical protein
MTKRIANRLLAVAAVFALALLATHAVTHWHTSAYDDQHCQVCHVGHAAIPQPTAQGAELAPFAVARFSAAEGSSPDFDAVRTPSVPRAPPT